MPKDSSKHETLRGLVARYSPSGEEGDAVTWLVQWMGGLGFTHAYIDKTGNAVGVMGTGKRQVVLLGHIDTVPGEIDVRIKSGPDGDLLYGRGTVDAKGPLAAFVDAAAATGQVKNFQIVVIGAIDEERESAGARGILDQYKPDFAIIGEPSNWERVTLGYKGSARVKIILRRSMAHTAGRLESAPEAAIHFWNRLTAWTTDFNHGRERIFDQVQPRLQGFSSENDGFEDVAVMNLGARLPADLDPEAWYGQLIEMGSDMNACISPAGYPIPAYRAEQNTPLVRAFLGGIRSQSGQPGFVVKTGTADLNIVAPAWDCPALAYGPGDSNLDHTPDEHLSLWEYDQAVKVLKAVLSRLAS